MRGRLVSKQGQILANALLAGVASGIGQAFTQSSTTMSISPLGSTSTVDTRKQLEAGMGTGVGKALLAFALAGLVALIGSSLSGGLPPKVKPQGARLRRQGALKLSFWAEWKG